jgi:hypothetical protein
VIDNDGDGIVDVGSVDLNEDGISEGVFGEDAAVPGLSSSTDTNQQAIDSATLDASHDAQTGIFDAQAEIDANLYG